MMLRSYVWKRKKILRGFLDTRIRRRGTPYDPDAWWDDDFYTAGISDSRTISPRKSELTSRYHYASVEMLLLRHLFHHPVPLGTAAVLDIGSGSGHWIDFWRSLGVASVDGIDVSRSAVEHLRGRYAGLDTVRVHQGRTREAAAALERRFDVVSAIGVMFHIVDDGEWAESLSVLADRLVPGGILVVGGHFGLLDGIDVQADRNGRVNKRLRSLRHWRRSLRERGFERFHLYRNDAYLRIRDTLPENSVLVAVKGAARREGPIRPGA